MNIHSLITQAKAELMYAEEMYPDWPTNLVEQSAIVVEEAGELLQACNNKWHNQKPATTEDILHECVQIMAMTMRFVSNLPDDDDGVSLADIPDREDEEYVGVKVWHD